MTTTGTMQEVPDGATVQIVPPEAPAVQAVPDNGRAGTVPLHATEENEQEPSRNEDSHPLHATRTYRATSRTRAHGRQRLSLRQGTIFVAKEIPISSATTALGGEDPGGTTTPNPQDEVPPQGKSPTKTPEKLGKENWLSDEDLCRNWVGPPWGGGSKWGEGNTPRGGSN